MEHLPPARLKTRGPRRIVSLVPHATELLFALGLGDRVVGVSHECDHPAAARDLPQVTSSALPAGLDAAGIDAAVRQLAAAGGGSNRLDVDLLERLRPDLVVTQALCTVCAVSHDEVVALCREMPGTPEVLALDPHTFGETLEDVAAVAAVCHVPDAGAALRRAIGTRVDRVRVAVRGADRPRVAAVEWFDPVYVAGHWTPQLIELAGGTDLLGLPGERSARTTFEELALLRPEVVVCMPCGYDAERSLAEAVPRAERLWEGGPRRVVAVDASGLFARPGPRLVDGLELLAHVLHPDRVPAPAADVLDVPRAATSRRRAARA
ncbi:ABC transporter substrate-binding protein [Patulibacter sp.]|uniref:ABC transporter substrate-binding protein n=1 Tax=Patulibacter sp. TaxID=1912859 RepID=UPI0027181A8F|nr:ABC transporter substrate-binding protein [Patulibacter sp.]MDO9408669.1 ABC transporter substrate-binding protein [Patulibacter sp.]